MAQTLETFDPAKAGFRVAEGPIARKPRRPSTRPAPKPKYADAVWYSFTNEHPLEVTVPVRAVEDTVRQLKRAARYLERTHGKEVRVQIGVEPVVEPKVVDGKPVVDRGEPVMVPVHPAKSLVKFLGHEPWLLGRRIAKEAATPAESPAQPPPSVAKHRRTTAGTRSSAGQHRAQASLPDALVWAVITSRQPSFPVSTRERGLLCFA